jgi:hypothetical protein
VGRNVTGKNILSMIPDAVVEYLDLPIMLQNPWNVFKVALIVPFRLQTAPP